MSITFRPIITLDLTPQRDCFRYWLLFLYSRFVSTLVVLKKPDLVPLHFVSMMLVITTANLIMIARVKVSPLPRELRLFLILDRTKNNLFIQTDIRDLLLM